MKRLFFTLAILLLAVGLITYGIAELSGNANADVLEVISAFCLGGLLLLAVPLLFIFWPKKPSKGPKEKG